MPLTVYARRPDGLSFPNDGLSFQNIGTFWTKQGRKASPRSERFVFVYWLKNRLKHQFRRHWKFLKWLPYRIELIVAPEFYLKQYHTCS